MNEDEQDYAYIAKQLVRHIVLMGVLAVIASDDEEDEGEVEQWENEGGRYA